MNRILLLALSGTVALAMGCSDQGPGDDIRSQIQTQRAIWDAQEPASYVYDVERLCFCGEEARGPVRVTVVNGSVHARAYTGDATPVNESFAQLFPDVDGLFDILEDAVDQDAERIQVNWDTVTGAPLDFFIDYDENVADEEQGYRIVTVPFQGG